MLTREAMVETFGESGLVRLDVEWAREKGLSDADARILSELGLPVRADVAFTTFVDEGPEIGAQVVFRTGSGEVHVLILGAVASDGAMRYFLDVSSGVVGLLDLEEPKAERVNSSLETFVEFLRRLRVRQQELVDSAGDLDNQEYTERLWAGLKELDETAFSHGEAWWAMVLDDLMKRALIAETRAFLDQRRAEVAAQLEEPEERDGSGRGAFDRALRELLDEGYEIVDAERFAADSESYGLLNLPADLDGHFDAEGTLVKDVQIAWKGAMTSKIQSLFARQGLVVRASSLPSGMVDDETLDAMSDEERQKYADSLMDGMVAAARGENRPDEGAVTCLAGDETSDLCRIVIAFDRLTARGYIAEPDLWPTPSGAWEQVQERVKPGKTRGAVFWTTQSHTDCFDDRGDLVGGLYLQWSGDPAVIAEELGTTGLEVEVPEDEGTAFVIRRSA